MNNPILITGVPRSGTSMTAGILSLCGLWGGKMVGPTKWNTRGMFENSAVRNTVIKPYLRSIGVDPLGQFPLPPEDIIDHPFEATVLKAKVLHLFEEQGLNGKRWFYKEPKIVIMWKLWHEAFPEATFVVVRRKRDQIINSCLRTGFMRAFDNYDGWKWWTDNYLNRIKNMKKEISNFHEIWPEKMIDGDLFEIKQLVKNIGLEWNFAAVKNFIEPNLWKNK